jgi:hypothetical protein
VNFLSIERLSIAGDERRLADYFNEGAPRPCIVTDAATGWPAHGKWSLDFFASRYGSHIGIAPLRFGVRPVSGKTTLLSAFIQNLDEPYAAMPGVWVGPEAAASALEDAQGWSFLWEAFKNDRSLLDDVSPFPPAIPNLTANLPADVYDALEAIQGRQFASIYISRRNTITPLHFDRDHTFGCLVQFQGSKRVVLFAPGASKMEGSHFDPENPDFERHPGMRGRAAYADVLAPVEMLIIPPDWLHYTRSEDHSITFSHNFFNGLNFGAFMRCFLADLADADEEPKLRPPMTNCREQP